MKPSGQKKQRVATGRTLLKNPSDLVGGGDCWIRLRRRTFRSLSRLSSRVAHRLSTVAAADLCVLHLFVTGLTDRFVELLF